MAKIIASVLALFALTSPAVDDAQPTAQAAVSIAYAGALDAPLPVPVQHVGEISQQAKPVTIVPVKASTVYTPTYALPTQRYVNGGVICGPNGCQPRGRVFRRFRR